MSNGTSDIISDSHTVGVSIGAEYSYFGLTGTVELNYEFTREIARTVERVVTQSTEVTCGSTCATGTSSEKQWMYQWKMRGSTIYGTDIESPWELRACHFVCTTDGSDPQCPLTRCADLKCTYCR